MDDYYDDYYKGSSSENRFLRGAKKYISRRFEEGKSKGVIPRDATIELFVGTDLGNKLAGFSRADYSRQWDGKEVPHYKVTLAESSIGDLDVVVHEGEHIVHGHPSLGVGSQGLFERGDFLGYLEREVPIEYSSAKRTNDYDYFVDSLVTYAGILVDDGGFELDGALELLKSVVKKEGIPIQYWKRAKAILEG